MRQVTFGAFAAVAALACATPVLAKARPKILKGEATYKADATHINLDDTPINGQRSGPQATEVGVGHAEKNYDFVKIRLRWHPEMVASASALD